MSQEILLFSPGCVCLFWAILLVGKWKENTLAQKICAIVLSLLAFLILGSLILLEEYKGINLPDQLTLKETLFLTIPATIFLYWLGYRFSAPILFAPSGRSNKKTTQPHQKQITKHIGSNTYKGYEKLLLEFNYLMDEEKIFRQKGLCREDVAHMLKTNRTYIAALIREEHQCGFSEFINRKRIAYAQELKHRYPELTQEQLVTKSGFSNISTFSRTFKQYTGTTFREWSRQL